MYYQPYVIFLELLAPDGHPWPDLAQLASKIANLCRKAASIPCSRSRSCHKASSTCRAMVVPWSCHKALVEWRPKRVAKKNMI